MSCDEKVIGSLENGGKQYYSRTLLLFAMGNKKMAGPLYFGENNTEKRIKNVLKYRKAGIAAAVLGGVLLVASCIFFVTDAKSQNQLAVSYTDEGSVLSSFNVEGKQTVKHSYELEEDIKSYLVYADIYETGVYGGRKIITCDSVTDYDGEFESMTLLHVTVGEEQNEVMIANWTDSISRMGTFQIPEKISMQAGDTLWDDGKSRKVEPDQPYIFTARYIGGTDTEYLECFRCENLNQADEEEWERCINQNCTTIMVYFVLSEKSESELRAQYAADSADVSEGAEQEEERLAEEQEVEQNTEGEDQAQIPLSQVMDRIIQENQDLGQVEDFLTYQDQLKDSENDMSGDRMVRLAETDDGKFIAYGFVSPEYGNTDRRPFGKRNRTAYHIGNILCRAGERSI